MMQLLLSGTTHLQPPNNTKNWRLTLSNIVLHYVLLVDSDWSRIILMDTFYLFEHS